MSAAPAPKPAWSQMVATVAISAAGGSLAQALGVPAGLLIGGMLATGAAALLGVRLWMPDWLRDIGFVMVGLTMGGAVARESLSLIAQWPVTMAALAFELVFLVFAISLVLRRYFKLDAGTSYLSAFPGHLSLVMGLAATGIGDARRIAVLQVSRVLVMSLAGPLVAMFFPVQPPPPGLAPQPMSLATLIGVALACAAMGYVFTRLKVSAGYVLGSMAVATVARLTGQFEGALPGFVSSTAFVLIGGLMGTRLTGISLKEIRYSATGGLLAALISLMTVTVVAYGASLFVDAPFPQIWIGIMPGGLETMGALGVALGYDTAFIAAHHVVRLVLLGIGIPLMVVMLRRRVIA
jgi:membrane AbrB-like protein